MTDDRYAQGKIYKLVSDNTDKIYIGSCCMPLHKRLHSHKTSYKAFVQDTKKCVTSSKELFELGGNVEIILIEDFPCKSKNELERRERFYIETTVCVNKKLPAPTQEEKIEQKKECDKQYYKANKDTIAEYYKEWKKVNEQEIAEYKKEWYQANKEQLAERQKERYKANKQTIREQHKQYYEANKQRLLEKQREYRARKKAEKDVTN